MQMHTHVSIVSFEVVLFKGNMNALNGASKIGVANKGSECRITTGDKISPRTPREVRGISLGMA